MNALSRVKVKTAGTSPTQEAWHSARNINLDIPIITIVLDTRARLQVMEGQHRFSALTGLLDNAIRKHVSLGPEPWVASNFEQYLTESLRGLKLFRVGSKSVDPFLSKRGDMYHELSILFDPACEHVNNLWSSFITRQSHTSASETIAAVFHSKQNSSAATTNYDQLLEWLTEPKTLDPLAHFGKYSTPNWDGYDAEPIGQETIDAARSFLRMLPDTFGGPDIAPGSDGTIGLEWVFADGPLRKLFVDIGPASVWSAYWRRASGERGGLPHEKITSQTKDVLEKVFKDLST